jgi:hypothetical protein
MNPETVIHGANSVIEPVAKEQEPVVKELFEESVIPRST